MGSERIAGTCKCGASLCPSSTTAQPYFEWEGFAWTIDQLEGGADAAFLTHAHVDHVPAPLRSPGAGARELVAGAPPIWTTELTRRLLEARGFAIPAGPEWKLGVEYAAQDCTLPERRKKQPLGPVTWHGIPSGHMEGAASLLVTRGESGQSLLYAGEFFPHPRGCLPALAPQKVTTLVIESTYGHPDWAHPPPGVAERQLQDHVRDFAQRGPVIVAGYAGGKMARLVDALANLNLPFIVPPEFAREWQVLRQASEDRGDRASVTDFTAPAGPKSPAGHASQDGGPEIYTRSQLRGRKGEEVRKKAIYLITPGDLRAGKKDKGLEEAPVVLCAGRVLDPAYRGEHPATAYVPLRDHPTFAELLAFTKACQPEDVWALPGQGNSLCWTIRHELGIPCNPLVTNTESGLPHLPDILLE